MRGGRPLVGRARELGELTRALQSAVVGRGALLMLVGEPGIGKSRLSEELAELAVSESVVVCFGRCWEVGGAPAFWPWIEALRSAIDGVPDPALRTLLGPSAPDIVQLLPEIADRAGVTSVPELAPIGERFRLFDAVSTLLLKRSSTAPLLLLFEDLHASDPASLELLAFLAPRISRARILIIGTYRDVEARLSTDNAQILAKACRHAKMVELSRLDRSSVAQLIQESELTSSEDLIDRVFRTTEGNPLFVDEVVRLLESQGNLQGSMSIPDGVRSAIGERIGRLQDETRQTVQIAAVAGREFTLSLVAEIGHRTKTESQKLLAEAARLGLLTEHSMGRYAFSHVLVRDVVYDEIEEGSRQALHLAIADLLGTRSDDLTAPLAEIAHHLVLAGPARAERALQALDAAAQRALQLLAYEDAIALLNHSLELLGSMPSDPERRFEILLEIGQAHVRAGHASSAKESCFQAAALARELGSTDLLARAALILSQHAMFGMVDQSFVALLEETLAKMPPGDSATRARLMARLAAAQQPAMEPLGPFQLAARAVEMARRVGSKLDLVFVLHSAGSALADLAPAADRLSVDRETIALAEELGEKAIAFRGYSRAFWDHIELADIAAADECVRACDRIAGEFRQPHLLWIPPMLRFTRYAMQGAFAEADHEHARAESIVARLEDPAIPMLYLGFARLGISCVKGDRAAIRAVIDRFPGKVLDPAYNDLAWGLVKKWSRVRAGLPHDDIELGLLRAMPLERCANGNRVALADVAIAIDDRDLVERLYRAMQMDLGHLMIMGMTGLCSEGPAEQSLMLLAMHLDRWDDAERHHRSARALAEKLGTRPALAHLDLHYARGLSRRGRPEDLARVQALARSASTTARSLGMNEVASDAEALLSGPLGSGRSFGNGRYVVQRQLGRGGQKTVYLVEDTALGRECALSWIDSTELAAEDRDRLKREARTLARMRTHPHVVTVFDIGEESGRTFVVTEHVSGGDLDAELARGVSIERTMQLARDLLSGLEAVHACGIVHRDLKPANVWLDHEGRPKIGDFGVALVADRTRLTMSGVLTATADYASPEQLLNQPIDGRSDLYSLGCLLYQLLAGRAPFTGPLTAVISQHLHATPSPPSAHNPAVEPSLDRMVLHLLAKSPADRPESARAALRELDAIDASSELDQLQSQKLASLGNLVAGIAHELNTPLGALQANVDVLQRAFGILSDALADEELGNMLRRNERVGRALATLEKTRGVTPEATQRITRIVRDLKSFARLDQASEESVDVRELLDQTIAVLSSDLGQRIAIVRRFDDVPPLRCRPQELNQVFYNLLVNAIQAIRDRGTVTVFTSANAGSIVVRVADTGTGIAKEHLSRIFDPGFTTKGVGVGVGLGLSIAYRIVESHSGAITAESEPGGGSVLTVRLPLEP